MIGKDQLMHHHHHGRATLLLPRAMQSLTSAGGRRHLHPSIWKIFKCVVFLQLPEGEQVDLGGHYWAFLTDPFLRFDGAWLAMFSFR